MDTFLNRFLKLQTELKAPKGQVNKFGGYKYRSCEDILEAVKPLLGKYHMALTTLRDTDSDAAIQNSAYAREAVEKKGMDEAQITGTASSYARKYALNGLFCIDDTKDPDTDEYASRTRGSGIKCEDCGCEITDYFDGHDTIPASILAKRAKERYGKVLCIKCAKSEMKKEK